jgi:hypothetical protein
MARRVRLELRLLANLCSTPTGVLRGAVLIHPELRLGVNGGSTPAGVLCAQILQLSLRKLNGFELKF